MLVLLPGLPVDCAARSSGAAVGRAGLRAVEPELLAEFSQNSVNALAAKIAGDTVASAPVLQRNGFVQTGF